MIPNLAAQPCRVTKHQPRHQFYVHLLWGTHTRTTSLPGTKPCVVLQGEEEEEEGAAAPGSNEMRTSTRDATTSQQRIPATWAAMFLLKRQEASFLSKELLQSISSGYKGGI